MYETEIQCPDAKTMGRVVAMLLSCDRHAGTHHMELEGDTGVVRISHVGLACLQERWLMYG